MEDSEEHSGEHPTPLLLAALPLQLLSELQSFSHYEETGKLKLSTQIPRSFAQLLSVQVQHRAGAS